MKCKNLGGRISSLICVLWLAIVWGWVSGSVACAADSSAKLNVILILIDDMGWTDLGCQGSRFYQTPQIDALAASGMRFTHGYSACTVCSPTRAAILTGKYPARLHITDWIAGHVSPKAKLKVPDWTKFLPHNELTLAEVFKQAGYSTASVGKWHLGGEEFGPKSQGFDVNIGGTHKGQPPSYFFPYGKDGPALPGLDKGEPNEYLTDRLTDEALKFVEANHQRPFFIYWPHYTVHTPLQAKANLIEKYQGLAKEDQPQRNATYAAMIQSLDESVGRLRAKLSDLKISERTVVVFTSDNGGLVLRDITSNVPARAGKGSAYEGGVRVPLIVSLPGTIAAGSTCDTPIMSIDFFPTLTELAGVSAPSNHTVDGVSVVSLLKQNGPLRREALYWHYPHYHPGGATPYSAIRDGDFRLVEFFETNKRELYDLKNDVGETKDLAAAMPEKAAQLHAKLEAWRKSVGAQLPTPNPDYDPNPQPAGKKRKGK